MPCHLPYIPTTPRSAAFCAHIHSTRTDHGSWVLFSARKAHELVLLFGDYNNRFDVRERTRTEIRLSAGSSTVAARNHGGGAPTTCTTHDELVQVRLSKGRPSWLSHTAAAPPSWIRLIGVGVGMQATARTGTVVLGCWLFCDGALFRFSLDLNKKGRLFTRASPSAASGRLRPPPATSGHLFTRTTGLRPPCGGRSALGELWGCLGWLGRAHLGEIRARCIFMLTGGG